MNFGGTSAGRGPGTHRAAGPGTTIGTGIMFGENGVRGAIGVPAASGRAVPVRNAPVAADGSMVPFA